MARQRGRFTIYDAMDEAGAFSKNPANASATNNDGLSIYAGPIQYPKMLYHPEGEEEVIVPGTMEDIKGIGWTKVGEQRAIIVRTVENEQEEAEALGDGWHLTARDAIIVGNEKRAKLGQPLRPVPPIGPMEKAAKLETETAELKRKLAEAEAALARREAVKEDILESNKDEPEDQPTLPLPSTASRSPSSRRMV